MNKIMFCTFSNKFLFTFIEWPLYEYLKLPLNSFNAQIYDKLYTCRDIIISKFLSTQNLLKLFVKEKIYV